MLSKMMDVAEIWIRVLDGVDGCLEGLFPRQTGILSVHRSCPCPRPCPCPVVVVCFCFSCWCCWLLLLAIDIAVVVTVAVGVVVVVVVLVVVVVVVVVVLLLLFFLFLFLSLFLLILLFFWFLFLFFFLLLLMVVRKHCFHIFSWHVKLRWMKPCSLQETFWLQRYDSSRSDSACDSGDWAILKPDPHKDSDRNKQLILPSCAIHPQRCLPILPTLGYIVLLNGTDTKVFATCIWRTIRTWQWAMWSFMVPSLRVWSPPILICPAMSSAALKFTSL